VPIANDLPEVLETTEPERLATGFIFTEGPLWHPDGYWYFVDLRRNQLLRLTPGNEPELVRTTIGGNGTTFDLQGRLIVCEGDDRRLTRMLPDGKVESLVDKDGEKAGFARLSSLWLLLWNYEKLTPKT
jgi:gluconolactonase